MAAGDHFRDVNGTHANSINAGYEAGLFTGTNAPTAEPRSGTFSPASAVLRDQMATFLVRMLHAVAPPAN